MYDLIIIGGGPAGVTAAIYAARKKLKTAFIASAWGGQSTVSEDIQNWIGTPHIAGSELAESFKNHLEEYATDTVDIRVPAYAETVAKTDTGFAVTLKDGATLEGKTLFLAVGSVRRKLSVPGAEAFEHKGLTYCATCDGPLFADRDVLVVGGGNAGFETAAQLLEYAKSVTLIDRNPTFKADEVTVAKLSAHPNFTALPSTDILEITGEQFVGGVRLKNNVTNEETTMPIGGIFAEIGMVPGTALVEGVVELNERKQIVTDPYTQQTKTPGVWAAGDCTDGRYHQNNIASGDAVKALEDLYAFLKTKN